MTGEKCYCRYCSHAHIQDDCLIWCSARRTMMADRQITRQRKCSHFEFNPMDVLSPFDKEPRYYQPRGEYRKRDKQPSQAEQLKII